MTQAIRKLLFLEDCVIIPGLGGFVSHYKPAVIDKATGTFIPPTKEIVFNHELVQNDGVLVSFISEKDGITADAARQQIDLFVEITKKKLEQNAPVYIDGIGQFYLDKSHEVCFKEDSGTNLFLESFGLAPFHLREVSHENHTGATIAPVFHEEESSRMVEFAIPETRKVHGNLYLRRLAVAVPLLIAFSLMPYHSRVADTLTSSRASMIPEPSLFRLNYPDAIKRDTAKTIIFPIQEGMVSDSSKSETVVREEIRSEEVKKAVIPAEVPIMRSGKYPVVAGCFKVKINAERLHKQLVDKGYPATITPSRNGFYKVSVESFASRQEAINGLARIKNAEPGMQFWVAL